MNVYTKDITSHPEFYIAKFTKNLDMPYLVFIHGGPGFNCGVVEHLIEHKNLFSSLNQNMAQRGFVWVKYPVILVKMPLKFLISCILHLGNRKHCVV